MRNKNSKTMNYKKLFGCFALLVVLVSCSKNRYDIDNVQAVQAEGTLLLPIASGDFTIMEMIERFEMDSMITFTESGNMTYHYSYEHEDAVSGAELLSFKDFELSETWPIDLPNLAALLGPIDTVVHFNKTITLESEHINVFSALAKSGKLRCGIGFGTNAIQLTSLSVHSSEITNAQGGELWAIMDENTGFVEVDLRNMHFDTEEANTLNLDFHVGLRLRPSLQPLGNTHYEISIDDLKLSEMRGWVEPYSTSSRIVTNFDVFPENVSGNLELEDVQLYLFLRNGFRLPAKLVVDTAEVSGEGFDPISVFETMPQVVEMGFAPEFEQVFHRTMAGRICAHGAIATATSDFIMNPDGLTDIVTVADTCSVAVRADVELPLSFTVNEAHYFDTVILNLSENLSADMPLLQSDMIKKLTLDLDLTSNIPLDLTGSVLMFDNESGQVTDVLADNIVLVSTSADGQPVSHTVTIEVTDDRIRHIMESNRLILDFDVDTQAREAVLNANQYLRFYVKAKIEYDGIMELKNE